MYKKSLKESVDLQQCLLVLVSPCAGQAVSILLLAALSLLAWDLQHIAFEVIVGKTNKMSIPTSDSQPSVQGSTSLNSQQCLIATGVSATRAGARQLCC